MSTALQLGQTDVTLYYRAFNATDSTPRTDLVFSTAGLTLGFVRERSAEVVATVGSGTAPVDLAADTTVHADWGFRTVYSNVVRADFPDALCAAAGAPKYVAPFLSLSGVVFVPMETVDLTVGDPRSASVDANVTALNGVSTSALAELTAAPAVNNASLLDQLRWSYHRLRNKQLVTATSRVIKRADGTTNVSSETLADDGTTFTANAAS